MLILYVGAHALCAHSPAPAAVYSKPTLSFTLLRCGIAKYTLQYVAQEKASCADAGRVRSPICQ
jgi:hypothetical protein